MRTNKHLGIWMDYTNAFVMELTGSTIAQNIVTSKVTHQEKEQSLNKGEKSMHNKEQQEQNDYFKELNSVIIDFDEVILFGPTNAKDELFNLLKTNHLYDEIKISVQTADKMTENQMHAFVKEYYN